MQDAEKGVKKWSLLLNCLNFIVRRGKCGNLPICKFCLLSKQRIQHACDCCGRIRQNLQASLTQDFGHTALNIFMCAQLSSKRPIGIMCKEGNAHATCMMRQCVHGMCRRHCILNEVGWPEFQRRTLYSMSIKATHIALVSYSNGAVADSLYASIDVVSTMSHMA